VHGIPSAPLSAQVPPLVEVEWVADGNEEEDRMRRTMEKIQMEMIASIEQQMIEMICGPRVVRGNENKAARADNVQAQIPRTQDVANTTDSPERLSAAPCSTL